MQKKVLILSGPTHEYIDPVRYLGNASSGRMGKALAEEAVSRGCGVEFISGPVAASNLPALPPPHLHSVSSAEEMLTAARALFPSADIVIFAAAVADYAPVEKRVEKMAKSAAEITLRLRPTPDIAKTLCTGKSSRQVAIGFALQTADGPRNARRKLQDKHLDGIVLNGPDALGAEKSSFSFLSRHAEQFTEWGGISKAECARNIFDAIEGLTA